MAAGAGVNVMLGVLDSGLLRLLLEMFSANCGVGVLDLRVSASFSISANEDQTRFETSNIRAYIRRESWI